MAGSGNDIGTLFRKLFFFCLPTAGMRTRYIYKHKDLFHHVGKQLFWQPRSFPADPDLISIGDNVTITSGVIFINHDVIYNMLNKKYETTTFKPLGGGVEIGNNVMIGSRTLILPNVRIGSNVIIGAGGIVSKDIPDNCIAAGVPCKPIGDFDAFVDKRRKMNCVKETDLVWKQFKEQRDEGELPKY